MHFFRKANHSVSYLPINEKRTMSSETNESTDIILRPRTPQPPDQNTIEAEWLPRPPNLLQEPARPLLLKFRRGCQAVGDAFYYCSYPLLGLLGVVILCALILWAVAFGIKPWRSHSENTGILSG